MELPLIQYNYAALRHVNTLHQSLLYTTYQLCHALKSWVTNENSTSEHTTLPDSQILILATKASLETTPQIDHLKGVKSLKQGSFCVVF